MSRRIHDRKRSIEIIHALRGLPHRPINTRLSQPWMHNAMTCSTEAAEIRFIIRPTVTHPDNMMRNLMFLPASPTSMMPVSS